MITLWHPQKQESLGGLGPHVCSVGNTHCFFWRTTSSHPGKSTQGCDGPLWDCYLRAQGRAGLLQAGGNVVDLPIPHKVTMTIFFKNASVHKEPSGAFPWQSLRAKKQLGVFHWLVGWVKILL